MTRPIPMIDDLTLDYVARAAHRSRQRVVPLEVLGLAGDVQQRFGRASHEIELAGVLVGEDAKDQLSSLQEKVASGDEADFTADISTALELEKVVVLAAEFQECAGKPGFFDYRILLRESPPLPEPAVLSPFGLGDDFGLGFDTDLLDDIADAAGQLQDAVEAAADMLDDLQALAGLADLSLDNPLSPLTAQRDNLESAAGGTQSAVDQLNDLLGGS